jgi:hypothetical protein
MASALLVIGLLFVGLGGWLLVWRLLHKYYLGEFWNNTPTPLSWGVTVMLSGAALACAGFVYLFQKCEFGCTREGGGTPGGTMVAGGIVALVGLSFFFCCKCVERKPEDEYYDWATSKDTRWNMSGLDFAALGIGLALLATDQDMGVCPQSCAQAVIG